MNARMGKKIRDPEAAAWDARLKSEGEDDDFAVFAAAYQRATGDRLAIEDRPEPPDFLCIREDGTIVGVELTQLRRSPEDTHWSAILHRQYNMPAWDALAEAIRLLEQKATKLPKFPTKENILVFISCEAEFDSLVSLLHESPTDELRAYGFDEIWLGDFRGIREGAHASIALAGLYPMEIRGIHPRPYWDEKPLG
jgi:hypothetical protein